MIRLSTRWGLAAALLVLPACSESSSTDAAATGAGFAPAPFDKTLVLIASQTLDPNAPHDDPRIESIQAVPFMIDGSYMKNADVLGLTDEEIAKHEADAKAQLKKRFGVDLDDPDSAKHVHFGFIMVEPEVDYRVYAMTGADVPPEGWRVLDGIWATFVSDFTGMTLGGEFDGVHVPVGTALPYGVYFIQSPEPMEIAYNAVAPLIPGPGGDGPVNCEVHHPVYGDGLTLGISTQVPVAGTSLVKVSLRTVMTFPAGADDPSQ